MYPPIRESARALIIDDAGKILLSRVTSYNIGISRDLWVTLGGRLIAGETAPVALKRELAEELAETRYEIGPEVWQDEEIVQWGTERVHLCEHLSLVKVRAAEYTFHDKEEAASTYELKWWTAADIAASDARFVPYDLALLLSKLLKEIPSKRKHVHLERPV